MAVGGVVGDRPGGLLVDPVLLRRQLAVDDGVGHVADDGPLGRVVELRGEEAEDRVGSASLADYRGSWVLVNVWASWCVPCRAESPALERFYEARRDPSFTILGIDSNDLSGDALGFVRKYGITYPQLRDGGGDFSQNELGTTGVPESFLVDPRGKLVVHSIGPVSDKYLRSNVVPYLTGKAKQ